MQALQPSADFVLYLFNVLGANRQSSVHVNSFGTNKGLGRNIRNVGRILGPTAGWKQL